jgi:hypothetical protein
MGDIERKRERNDRGTGPRRVRQLTEKINLKKKVYLFEWSERKGKC